MVHPIIDSILDRVAVDGVGNFLQGFRFLHSGESVAVFLVVHASFIKFEPDSIMSVEVELAMKGEIGRYFQVTWPAQDLVVEVDVVLLDRFSALI